MPFLNQNELTLNGADQCLFLAEPFKSFCSAPEKLLTKDLEKAVFYFNRLIFTSANIRGDIGGSITEIEKAEKFALDQRIDLFVKFELKSLIHEEGSFPIFSILDDKFKIELKGPNQ